MNLFQSQSKLIVLIVCLTAFFVIPDQIKAQRKGNQRHATHNRSVKKRALKKAHKMSYLPHGFKQIRHRNKNYFYHRGLYYQSMGINFEFVRAPFGYQIKHLPIGYSLIYVSGHPYYYYYGNYYRFDSFNDIYIVCEKPTDEDEEFDHISGLDEIQMANGKIYHGRYLGGNEKSVQIELNGEIKTLLLMDIISIQYASPQETDKDN